MTACATRRVIRDHYSRGDDNGKKSAEGGGGGGALSINRVFSRILARGVSKFFSSEFACDCGRFGSFEDVWRNEGSVKRVKFARKRYERA